MTTEIEIALAKNRNWMTPIEQAMGQAVARFYRSMGGRGQKLENALHGTWLGHPLHPVLTDVPLGAWTIAVALDAVDAASGRDKYADGADAAVCIGLIGATGSALAGLTDWHKTDGKARRAGLVHGL